MRRLSCVETSVRGSRPSCCRVRAMLAVQRGNPDEAIAIVREGLAEIRKLQDKFAFVNAADASGRRGGSQGR